MVNKFLPITMRHHTIYVANSSQMEQGHVRASLTMVVLQTSTQVLRVCRDIRYEALATMELQLQRMRKITPRVKLDSRAVHVVLGANGLFILLANWFFVLRGNEQADFDSWSLPYRQRQLPHGPLRSIRQAAYQMLLQWHKLEYLDQTPGAESTAALFLGCRFQNDASLVSEAQNNEDTVDHTLLRAFQ
jgi:hypothetical protein